MGYSPNRPDHPMPFIFSRKRKRKMKDKDIIEYIKYAIKWYTKTLNIINSEKPFIFGRKKWQERYDKIYKRLTELEYEMIKFNDIETYCEIENIDRSSVNKLKAIHIIGRD